MFTLHNHSGGRKKTTLSERNRFWFIARLSRLNWTWIGCLICVSVKACQDTNETKQSVILVPFGGWLLCKSLILPFKLDPNYKLIIANSVYVTLIAKVDHSNHYVYKQTTSLCGSYVGVGKSNCIVKRKL